MRKFSTNIKDIKKSFLFTRKLRQKLLAGTKTQTRRQLPNTYEVGDLAYVRTKRGMFKVDSPAIIKITALRTERMRDISAGDLVKEGFKSKEEFIELIYTLYPKEVKEAMKKGEIYNPIMVVVDFELVQTNPKYKE